MRSASGPLSPFLLVLQALAPRDDDGIASRRTVTAASLAARLSTESSSLIDLLRRTELHGEASSSFRSFS